MKTTTNLIYSLLVSSFILMSCGANSDEKYFYNDGYKSGKQDAENGEKNSCTDKLSYMALRNMSGNQEDKKDKFCEGYEDGLNNKPNKYPE